MTAVGLQSVSRELKNPLILDAKATGRILSFDFPKDAGRGAIPTENDIETFFTRLMIYFLCLMFHGCQVDGIWFEKISPFSDVSIWIGRQQKFQIWLEGCKRLTADDMMDEYIRSPTLLSKSIVRHLRFFCLMRFKYYVNLRVCNQS